MKDIAHGSKTAKRAMILQQKTQSPVQFKITKHTRESMIALIDDANLSSEDYSFKWLVIYNYRAYLTA